jgi:hypothetical protein
VEIKLTDAATSGVKGGTRKIWSPCSPTMLPERSRFSDILENKRIGTLRAETMGLEQEQQSLVGSWGRLQRNQGTEKQEFCKGNGQLATGRADRSFRDSRAQIGFRLDRRPSVP